MTRGLLFVVLFVAVFVSGVAADGWKDAVTKMTAAADKMLVELKVDKLLTYHDSRHSQIVGKYARLYVAGSKAVDDKEAHEAVAEVAGRFHDIGYVVTMVRDGFVVDKRYTAAAYTVPTKDTVKFGEGHEAESGCRFVKAAVAAGLPQRYVDFGLAVIVGTKFKGAGDSKIQKRFEMVAADVKNAACYKALGADDDAKKALDAFFALYGAQQRAMALVELASKPHTNPLYVVAANAGASADFGHFLEAGSVCIAHNTMVEFARYSGVPKNTGKPDRAVSDKVSDMIKFFWANQAGFVRFVWSQEGAALQVSKPDANLDAVLEPVTSFAAAVAGIQAQDEAQFVEQYLNRLKAAGCKENTDRSITWNFGEREHWNAVVKVMVPGQPAPSQEQGSAAPSALSPV